MNIPVLIFIRLNVKKKKKMKRSNFLTSVKLSNLHAPYELRKL